MNPIKIFALTLVLLFGNSYSFAEDKPHTFLIEIQEIQDKSQIIGKWAFSEDWMGEMGIAIEFTKDEYRYWFYSDVKNGEEPKYPITGKWNLVGGVLSLNEPNEGTLYAKEWTLVKSNGVVGLMNPENIKILLCHKAQPTSRMLKKLPEHSGEWPVMNYPKTIK